MPQRFTLLRKNSEWKIATGKLEPLAVHTRQREAKRDGRYRLPLTCPSCLR